jgi:hypothetical protein
MFVSLPLKKSLLFPLLLSLLGATPNLTQAALLVYEGFAGYDSAVLHGQPVNANSQGLSGSWIGDSYPNQHEVVGIGLSFEGLASSGGALSLSGSTRLSGIAMSHAGAAAGSTLFSSYLVNSNISPTVGSGILTRINGTSAIASSGYFSSFADGRSGTAPAVGYNSTFDPANETLGSSALATGQTFIVISSFTNVGSSTGGTANLYVLSQTQFLNLRSIGLSNLSTLAVGQGATEAWATASSSSAAFNGSFDSADFLHILSLASSATIDELRYGTTLESVLPIPEASSSLAACVAALCMIGRRKRNTA